MSYNYAPSATPTFTKRGCRTLHTKEHISYLFSLQLYLRAGCLLPKRVECALRASTARKHCTRWRGTKLCRFRLPPRQATVYENIMVGKKRGSEERHSRHPRLNKDLMSDWQETAHDDTCASTPCGTRGIDGCPRCKLKAVQEHLR